MAQQLRHIDISHRPELLDLVEQAQSADQALLLRRGGEDVAILRPVKRPSKRVARRGVLTHEDPLFSLVGIGESKIPGGIFGKKHDYLLEAYRQQHT